MYTSLVAHDSTLLLVALYTSSTMAESKNTKKTTFIDMIVAAIGNLKEKNGSSTQAIKKYLTTNYNVDTKKNAAFIRRALISGVEKKRLTRTKGTGASGTFKLNTEAAKAQVKKAKEAEKKKAQKVKEAAKKKSLKEKAAAKKKAQKEKAKKKKPVGDKKEKKASKKTKAPTKKVDKPKKATKKTPKKDAKKAKPTKKASTKKATKKTPKKAKK